jgi:hypothetical protein
MSTPSRSCSIAGQHHVLIAAARRRNVELRVALIGQAAVGPHAGHESGALGVGHQRRPGQRLDGRKVARRVQAVHILVKLLPRDRVGGLEQGHQPARQVGIRLDARRDAVLGAARQVLEALAGVIVHRLGRKTVQHGANPEGHGAAHAPERQACATDCFSRVTPFKHSPSL